MEQTIGQPARRDIIMLALARHDRAYSSTAWSLAKSFAMQGRVFFIDNPFTFKDFSVAEKRIQLRKRFKYLFVRRKDLFQVEGSDVNIVVTPLMLPINWIPAGFLYRALNRFNTWLLKRAINKTINRYNLRDYIFINSFNPIYALAEKLDPQPAIYLYQTVDNISHSNYVAKHGPRLEAEEMKKAAFTITTSENLRLKAAAISKRAYCVPNAADIALFNSAVAGRPEVPPELRDETREVICYTGSIDHRLDYDLLISAASKLGDKLFLMVGPVTGPACPQSGFDQLPNVLFTGRKQLEDLPSYLRFAHCTIIPFKCNELTASIYPLKINEYLAAGKSVITTPFSQDILKFKEVIRLADNGEDFAEAITEAIRNDSPQAKQKRIKVASENNWESRANMIHELVETYFSLLPEKETKLIYEEKVKQQG